MPDEDDKVDGATDLVELVVGLDDEIEVDASRELLLLLVEIADVLVGQIIVALFTPVIFMEIAGGSGLPLRMGWSTSVMLKYSTGDSYPHAMTWPKLAINTFDLWDFITSDTLQ